MIFATNLSEVRDIVLKETLKAMKSNDEKNKEIMKLKYEEEVENKYTPIEYQRTNQMKNATTSITERVNDMISTSIFTDTNRLNANPSYPYATTFPSGEDFTEYLPMTIEYGLSGSLFGNGDWRKPRRYTLKTFEYLKKNYIKDLKNSLYNQGLILK